MKISGSSAEEQAGQFADRFPTSCWCGYPRPRDPHAKGTAGCVFGPAEPTAEEIGVKQAFERTGAGSQPNQLGPTSEAVQTVVSDSESDAALNMARVLKECVDEIRAEIDARYTKEALQWECNKKRKERDMEIVRRGHDAVWRFQQFRTEEV